MVLLTIAAHAPHGAVAHLDYCVRSGAVSAPPTSVASGLSLAPFRALRPTVASDRLGALLCPPYDVIDESLRTRLLAADADNTACVILPPADAGGAAYA